jgi:carbamoyl-phosphate synthase large subunit
VSPRGNRTTNLLFTSSGRRVELLRCFRKAYDELGLRGRIVAADASPLAPALWVADRACIVPRLDAPQYAEALAQIVRDEQIDVILPLIDPDIPALNAARPLLEAAGARLAVVGPEAEAIAADKWRTTQFFRDLQLPLPRSWLPGELDPASAEYPLFVKPRFGSASQDAFRVENAEQLHFFTRYVRSAIIQECLTGPEITIDVVCDLDGSVLSVVLRERLRVRAGEVAIGRLVRDEAIAEACVTIARALPARGPLTVQGMFDQGKFKFVEINARLGGGAPAVVAVEKWPQKWLARIAEISETGVAPPSTWSPGSNLYFTRFDDTMVLSEADLEQLGRGPI